MVGTFMPAVPGVAEAGRSQPEAEGVTGDRKRLRLGGSVTGQRP